MGIWNTFEENELKEIKMEKNLKCKMANNEKIGSTKLKLEIAERVKCMERRQQIENPTWVNGK